MKTGMVVIAAIALCLPASAQQFWNSTKAGMTRAQVKATLGNAIKAEQGSPDRYLIENRFAGPSSTSH
jgi:hypothetical protein